jgi:hypothetical protein
VANAFVADDRNAEYLTRGLRERVDEMIWEAEKDAENAEMRTSDETPEIRSREFRVELPQALKARSQQNPHKALREAAMQLEMPGLRHSHHRLRVPD